MLRNRNAEPEPVELKYSQSPPPPPLSNVDSSRLGSPFKSNSEKISECLYAGGDAVDLEKLKKLTWTGIPSEFRAICWKMLMVWNLKLKLKLKLNLFFFNQFVVGIFAIEFGPTRHNSTEETP